MSRNTAEQIHSSDEKNDAWSATILQAIQDGNDEIRDGMKAMSERMDSVDAKIEPLVEVYDGALFVRKFVIGIAAVIIAIGAIGAGIIWVIQYIRHG